MQQTLKFCKHIYPVIVGTRAYTHARPPLTRGLSAEQADWGEIYYSVFSPSVTASPCHLPEGELAVGQEMPAWAVTQGRLIGRGAVIFIGTADPAQALKNNILLIRAKWIPEPQGPQTVLGQ